MYIWVKAHACKLDSSQQSCPELPWAPTAAPCISSISFCFAQHHCADSLGESGLALAWTRKVNGLFVRNMPSILKRKFSYRAFNHVPPTLHSHPRSFPETPAGKSLQQHPKHRTRTIWKQPVCNACSKAARPFLAKPPQLLPTRFLSQGCTDDFWGLWSLTHGDALT